MSVVERLLKEQKEREDRRNSVFAAVKALPADDRCTVAVAVIAELPPEDLHKVVAQLIRHVEKQAETEPEAKASPKAELPKVSQGTPPHVAGRMALHGIANGTPAPTLSTAPRTGVGKKKTQRDFITEVIVAAGRAMGTGEIGKAVLTLAPELNFASVKAEVQRMRKDGLLVIEGSNGRGGLHRLATGMPKEHLNGVS